MHTIVKYVPCLTRALIHCLSYLLLVQPLDIPPSRLHDIGMNKFGIIRKNLSAPYSDSDGQV